jgi:hypothetical protein
MEKQWRKSGKPSIVERIIDTEDWSLSLRRNSRTWTEGEQKVNDRWQSSRSGSESIHPPSFPSFSPRYQTDITITENKSTTINRQKDTNYQAKKNHRSDGSGGVSTYFLSFPSPIPSIFSSSL